MLPFPGRDYAIIILLAMAKVLVKFMKTVFDSHMNVLGAKNRNIPIFSQKIIDKKTFILYFRLYDLGT